MTKDNNQIKSWILPKPVSIDEITNSQVNYILQKVLCRRGINIVDDLNDYLIPPELPNPEDHFNELSKASNRIIDACNKNEKIAICGDYDADGITSTVLLIEILTKLGAKVTSFIPSRKEDGYGLNIKIINEIYNTNISLAITVDNGVSAYEAINRAKELGIDLIITDHHKLTDRHLDVFALIHPELIPHTSPYKFLAGVGIAYMLSKHICKQLNFDIDKTTANVFFCIGTVADMAPLVGANRKWLKECLPKIKTSDNIGIRSIFKKLSIDNKDISSDDIGFKIAPLINAVGRISEPKLIINLLTTTSESTCSKLIKECFAINKERKRLTGLLEIEALDKAFLQYSLNKKFIVLTNRHWHPGIIGIVAARIVEKFNLPTALLSMADNGIFRGSIRSINPIKVNLALAECDDLLIAHGGHSAAAGFSVKEENIPLLSARLNEIAMRELKNINLDKSIKPEAHINFKHINCNFYKQLMLLSPFGIKNPAPIFWTRKCRILDVYKLKGNHLKMTLDDGTGYINAIKWNISKEFQINDLIDIAFYIEMNRWKKTKKMQLNIVDMKIHKKIIELQLHNRFYKCQLTDKKEILITNTKGESISSDFSKNTENIDNNESDFAKKILSFAEIALGKAA